MKAVVWFFHSSQRRCTLAFRVCVWGGGGEGAGTMGLWGERWRSRQRRCSETSVAPSARRHQPEHHLQPTTCVSGALAGTRLFSIFLALECLQVTVLLNFVLWHMKLVEMIKRRRQSLTYERQLTGPCAGQEVFLCFTRCQLLLRRTVWKGHFKDFLWEAQRGRLQQQPWHGAAGSSCRKGSCLYNLLILGPRCGPRHLSRIVCRSQNLSWHCCLPGSSFPVTWGTKCWKLRSWDQSHALDRKA